MSTCNIIPSLLIFRQLGFAYWYGFGTSLATKDRGEPFAVISASARSRVGTLNAARKTLRILVLSDNLMSFGCCNPGRCVLPASGQSFCIQFCRGNESYPSF